MNCEHVREHLLTEPATSFVYLEAHFERCPECRALADRVLAAEQNIELEVDDFVAATSFEVAWQAVEAPPAPVRWRPSLQAVLIAAAVAATLLLAVPIAFLTGPPESATSAAGLEPLRPVGPPDVLPDDVLCPSREELSRAVLPRRSAGTQAAEALTPLDVRCLEDMVDQAGEEARFALPVLLQHHLGRGEFEVWADLVREHLDDVEHDGQFMYRVLVTIGNGKHDVEPEQLVGWIEAALARSGDFPPESRADMVRALMTMGGPAAQQAAVESSDPARARHLRAMGEEWTRRGYSRQVPSESPPRVVQADVEADEGDPGAVPRSGKETRAIVFLSGASGAEIVVDGRAAPVLPAMVNLVPGPHRFQVRCGDTTVFDGRVVVGADEGGDITLIRLHEHRNDVGVFMSPVEELERLCQQRPAPGGVSVMVFLESAAGATLLIDDEVRGPLPVRTRLSRAPHVFEVRCSDEVVFRGQVTVESSASTVVKLHEVAEPEVRLDLATRKALCL